jgi:hypothetical protein
VHLPRLNRLSPIPTLVSDLCPVRDFAHNELKHSGGSGYSGTPAPPPSKPAGVLPVKEYLSFKQINLQAVKTKATQFAEDIKSSTVSASRSWILNIGNEG